VTLHDVATAIELEASYQIWRTQHEKYLLLSRRIWLDRRRVETGPTGRVQKRRSTAEPYFPASPRLPRLR
jgi:hypothetical protein